MKNVPNFLVIITVLCFLNACSQSRATSKFPIADISIDSPTHDVYLPNPLED